MKKKDIFVHGSAAYEPPQINIFTFEVEGVLCGSVMGGGDEDGDNEVIEPGGDDIEGWG